MMRAGSDSLEGELDKLVPALLKQQGVPGVSIAVVKEGEVIWAKGCGLADKSKGTPVRTDMRFNIGSVSKTVTAWAVLPLANELLVSHDGANEGWRAIFLLHPQTGDGVVILTNNDLGGKVMGQIACACFARTRVNLGSLCAGLV